MQPDSINDCSSSWFEPSFHATIVGFNDRKEQFRRWFRHLEKFRVFYQI